MRQAIWTIPLRLAVLAVVVAVSTAGTCDGDPSVTPKMTIVREMRRPNGTLQAITVEGSGFTKNGTVRVNFLFRRLEGSAIPISVPTPPAAEVTADANGSFRFQRDPMPCPNAAVVEFTRGSWLTIIGSDAASSKFGSAEFTPGSESDCVAF